MKPLKKEKQYINKDTKNINSKAIELTEKILDKISYYNKTNELSYFGPNTEERVKVSGCVGSHTDETIVAFANLEHYKPNSKVEDKYFRVHIYTDESHSYFTIHLDAAEHIMITSGYIVKEHDAMYNKVSKLYDRMVELVKDVNHNNMLRYEVKNVTEAERNILLMDFDIDNF